MLATKKNKGMLNNWGNALFYPIDMRNISCCQWLKRNHVHIHEFRKLVACNYWFEYWKINFCIIPDFNTFQSCSSKESLIVAVIIVIADVILIIMIYWNEILTCKLSTSSILYLPKILKKINFSTLEVQFTPIIYSFIEKKKKSKN